MQRRCSVSVSPSSLDDVTAFSTCNDGTGEFGLVASKQRENGGTLASWEFEHEMCQNTSWMPTGTGTGWSVAGEGAGG